MRRCIAEAARLDPARQQAYYYDCHGQRTTMEAAAGSAAEARHRVLRDSFEAFWPSYADHEVGSPDPSTWRALRADFVRAGMRLPAHQATCLRRSAAKGWVPFTLQ